VLRQVFEQAAVAIGIIASDFTLLYGNAAYEELLGQPLRERIGHPYDRAIMTPDMARASRAALQSLLDGQVPEVRAERAIVRPDGSTRWTLASSRRLDPGDGGAPYLLSQLIDITALHDATDALREAEARYRSVVEQSLTGIYIIQDGRFAYVNPRFAEVFGYTPEEIYALPSFAALTAPGTTEMVARNIERRLGGEARDLHYESRGIRKDGTLIDIEVHGTAAEYRGHPAILGALLDVTAQKEAARALREREEQLRQAQKMEAVGQLAGGIAHDFNNMLTAVLSNAELALLEMDAGAAPRELVAEIADAARRACSLTQQLLAFSRRQMLQPRVLSLNAAVTDAESMLRRMIGVAVRMRTTLAPDAGDVSADPGQLAQVIMNLALNARDAMPRGGSLTIATGNREVGGEEAAAHPGLTPGAYVVLTVQDTGEGIPADVLPHIFEPFFTTKPQGKGTGLGLATVYGIVKQSGGYVAVETGPGAGTTFTIYLPRVFAPEPEQAPARTSDPQRLLACTVLLVEDDRAVRDVTSRILEAAGCSVVVADNGRAALDLWARYGQSVELVITDAIMPEMGGAALVQELRRQRPGLPVLYISGYTQGTVEIAAAERSSTRFLPKPFTQDQLLLAMRELLD
jgi:PAS domain S-box-containing protein